MDKYNKALEYEIFIKKEYWLADRAIKQAKLIFDIGWHIGLFSQYCLSLSPWCTIHYFEPITTLYQQAKQTIKNQNIILNNFGISAKTWQQNMYFNPEKTMQSSKFNQTFLNPKWEEIFVDMKNLEEYCLANKIESIDFLKIDTEGMEYEIIDSLSDKFLSKIKTILIEYHCFDDNSRFSLQILEDRLSKYFKIQKFDNKYSKDLWYIFWKFI